MNDNTELLQNLDAVLLKLITHGLYNLASEKQESSRHIGEFMLVDQLVLRTTAEQYSLSIKMGVVRRNGTADLVMTYNEN